jgi:hypothetical protein
MTNPLRVFVIGGFAAGKKIDGSITDIGLR